MGAGGSDPPFNLGGGRWGNVFHFGGGPPNKGSPHPGVSAKSHPSGGQGGDGNIWQHIDFSGGDGGQDCALTFELKDTAHPKIGDTLACADPLALKYCSPLKDRPMTVTVCTADDKFSRNGC